MKLDDLNKRYRAQAARQLAAAITATLPPANVEQGAGDGALAKEEVKGFNRPVSLSYFETRKRLADSDGACTKYATDALVSAGILRNDSPLEIPERPTHKQTKGKEEETIIEIREYIPTPQDE